AYVARNYATGGIPLALLVALTTLAATGDHRRTALAAVAMVAGYVLVRGLWVYQGFNYRRTLISPGLVIGGGIAASALGFPVDLAAYRIVQESLTNVIRHAGAEAASVSVSYEDDRVVVEVDDHGGEGDDGGRGSGSGLVGMRERALALGGEFEAGPRGDGGF